MYEKNLNKKLKETYSNNKTKIILNLKKTIKDIDNKCSLVVFNKKFKIIKMNKSFKNFMLKRKNETFFSKNLKLNYFFDKKSIENLKRIIETFIIKHKNFDKVKKDYIFDELIPIKINENFKNFELFLRIVKIEILKKKKTKNGNLLIKYKSLIIGKIIEKKKFKKNNFKKL